MGMPLPYQSYPQAYGYGLPVSAAAYPTGFNVTGQNPEYDYISGMNAQGVGVPINKNSIQPFDG